MSHQNTTIPTVEKLTVKQIEYEIINQLFLSHQQKNRENAIAIEELSPNSQGIIHAKFSEEAGKGPEWDFYSRQHLFSNEKRKEVFEFVDPGSGRATLIGSATVLSFTEFSTCQKDVHKRQIPFNASPQFAWKKWKPLPKYGMHQHFVEVSNFTCCDLLTLAQAFTELDATSIDNMREILAGYKLDRFGKAIETAKSINMFWNQLWAVFCSIFGAGKYSVARSKITETTTTGLQKPLFVHQGRERFSFCYFAETDRLSRSQLTYAKNSELCLSLVNDLAQHLTHDTMSPEQIATELLINKKGLFNKPVCFHNPLMDPGYFAEIKQYTKDWLAKFSFTIKQGSEEIVMELFSRKQWMFPVCDIISEKFDKGTLIELA